MTGKVNTRSQSQSSSSETPQQESSSAIKLDDNTMESLITRISAAVSSNIIDEMNAKIASVKMLIDNTNAVVSENSALIKKVDHKVDNLEQYTRRNNLRIYGIDEERGENTDKLIIESVNKILGPIMSIDDVERSHRIGKFQGNKPRPIIVKFLSYRKRKQIYDLKSKFKGTPCVINEDLTTYRYKVLQAAKSKYGSTHVWSSDGNLFWKDGNAIKKPSYLEMDNILLSAESGK